MKNTIITILFLVFTNQIFACRCFTPNITTRVTRSGFVATAKIKKVTPNVNDSRYSNVEIEIMELYKGKSISNIKTIQFGSCLFKVFENTTWLIFASKDNNGFLSFGSCSGAKQIDKKFNSIKYPNHKERYDKGIKSKLEFLSFLKDEKIVPLNEFNISAVIPPTEYFNSRRLVYSSESTKKATHPILFELTINKDLSIKKVKILQKLKDKKFKLHLIKYIKINTKIIPREKLLKIPRKTKILLEI